MVNLLPTNPLTAAELAVTLCPRDMPIAALRDACVTVQTKSHDTTALAHARRVARAIDEGTLI